MALLMAAAAAARRATSSTLLGAGAASSVFARFSSSSVRYDESGSDSDVDYCGDKCVIIAKGGDNITRSDKFDIKQGCCDPYMRNPFQTAGPKGAYEVKQVEGGVFLRMEMPGINKEDLKIWVEDDDTVYVKGGDEESTVDDEDTYYAQSRSRSYYAKVIVPTDGLMIDEMEAEIKNGVLQLLIPSSKVDLGNEVDKKLLEIKIK